MTISAVGSLVAARAVALPPLEESDGLLDLSGEQAAGSTSPTVREEAIDAIERHLCDHYARRPGIAPLCRAVAATLSAEGVPTGENDVVISGSVSEARYVAVRTLAAGKSVWLPDPAPTLYDAALAFAGAEVHRFDPHAELPAAQGGLLILSNPSPLTGQVAEAALLERLAAWAVAGDMGVIADETVGPILPTAPFVRMAALPGTAERTLTLGSFADIPGLTAWQVSWFSGPKKLFQPVRDLKQSITICTVAASQFAALAAAAPARAGHDAIAQEVERLEVLTGVLERHNLPFWQPDVPVFVAADVSSLGGSAAVVAACRAAGLLVGDGERLGLPGAVRIAVPAGDLGDAAARLDSALSSALSTLKAS
jgi:aspartate/methionine/tyrosine aminotransferase